MKLTKEIFGLRSSVHYRTENKSGIEISVCNSKLANIFENLCGKGAQNKHIPYELEYLAPKKQKIIVDAIEKGDGHISRVAKTKRPRYQQNIATISIVLAYQIRDILLRNGMAPSILLRKEKRDKNNVFHQKSFWIQWQEKYILNFSSFYKDKKNNIHYWLLPIYRIKKHNYNNKVYNLTVSTDHSYTTPTFTVGNCGLGGDIFGFVMQMENLDFGSALRMLANKAGVKLVSESPQLRSEKNKLVNIIEESIDYFQKNLWQNQEAIDYLHKRGLKDEPIKEFQLGFAIDDWRSLMGHLLKRGFQPEEIERAGLVIRKKPANITTNIKITANDIYDRFRSRIMFPIKDVSGSAVGFTGRIYQGSIPLKTVKKIEEVGKYVNTPQTLIFDKGKILYGLDKTKNDLRTSSETVIVEGQMDFLAAYQNGIKNIVASSGTALTPYQLATLKRHNNKLVLAYDMDEAGQIATERGISLALNSGLELKVLNLPKSKDIADFVLEEPNKLKTLIKESEPIMDFYFRRAKGVADPNGIEGKKQITSYLLPKIKNLSSAIDRSFWLEKLSNLVSVPVKVLEDEIPKIKIEPVITINEPEEVITNEYVYRFDANNALDRRQVLGERIITLSLQEPELFSKVLEFKDCFIQPYSQIIDLMKKDPKGIINKDKIREFEPSEELIKTIDFLYLKGEYEVELLKTLEIDLIEEIDKNLIELKREHIKNQLIDLNYQIKDMEKCQDKDKLKDLLDEFNNLSKQLSLN